MQSRVELWSWVVVAILIAILITLIILMTMDRWID